RGFRTFAQREIAVQSGKTRVANFVMDLLPFEQVVTVESAPDDSNPAASGLSLARHSSATTLPANGRDLHAYYAIMPGATITPAVSSGGGQFTVDGQRPNTNSVRIDGISGNTGLGISATPGTYSGSSLPGMTVIGSTQNLASKEDIERVELRSSDFAPEYGDRPGAQIVIETRSGSNRFHGNALAYVRPRSLDSRDRLAQKYGFPLDAASLNGYGASLGGPLSPNRTFFFAAFERVIVHDTALKLMPAPSAAARAAAKNPYPILLDAFPLPTGPSLNADESLATVPLEKQASVENYSVRIDQVLGEKGRLFARYANVPSRSVTKQLGVTNAGFRWVTATLGSTAEWKGAIHDFRFNYSRLTDTSSWAAGSAREQAAFDAFSNPALSPYTPSTVTGLSIAGIGQLLSGVPERTYQNQWEGTYTLAKQFGQHNFRAGADYIRLLPRTLVGNFVQTTAIVSPGVASLLAGDPLGVTASYGKPTIQSGQIPIASLFAQDTYKLSNRLNIQYGLRWEITPPGSTALGGDITSVDAWNGPGATPHRIGSYAGLDLSKWRMRYTQIAPRLGLAYRLKKPDLVLRGGAGIFYDDALGSLIHPVNLSPFNTWQFLPSSSNLVAVPPAIAFLNPPELYLPEVWEWRASIEKSLEGRSKLSLAYVGSAGRKLLRLQGTVYPKSGILKGTAFTSYGESDYEALQAQLIGNLTSRLYALMSYTWGHSIDTGSEASSVFLTRPGYTGAQDRGSSNFDVRHNLSASLSYRLPSPHGNGRLGAWLSGWNLSSTVQARSGFPFDITSFDRSIGLGFANTGRPNLVPGVPVWLRNNSVPGGRELNPAAFAPTSGLTNGTLGRNVLTGPGLFQIDASLRRQFRLFRGSSLDISLNAFNLLNQANFSNPIGYLGSAFFGRPASMQNLMLGSGSPTTGLTPIFQSGGPRTVEVQIKIGF
ncbi:MAG: hypothetical protein ACRD45_22360, partial [Bryobacteraceae bacterium]